MYIFKITKAKPRADQVNLLGVFGCNILFNIVKVSTVATLYNNHNNKLHKGFNTASGKYCCNELLCDWHPEWLSEFQYRKR